MDPVKLKGIIQLLYHCVRFREELRQNFFHLKSPKSQCNKTKLPLHLGKFCLVLSFPLFFWRKTVDTSVHLLVILYDQQDSKDPHFRQLDILTLSICLCPRNRVCVLSSFLTSTSNQKNDIYHFNIILIDKSSRYQVHYTYHPALL